jgi:hypothetical protein
MLDEVKKLSEEVNLAVAMGLRRDIVKVHDKLHSFKRKIDTAGLADDNPVRQEYVKAATAFIRYIKTYSDEA